MTRTVSHDTFSIERIYPSSPGRVFTAFAEPETKAQWFCPPDLKPQRTLDFQVGGRETLSMTIPDRGSFTFDAVYQDIVPDQRIIYSYEMAMDGKRISVSVATVELLAHGSGTRVVVTEQGAFLDGLDNVASRQEGSEGLLNALGRYLEEAPA